MSFLLEMERQTTFIWLGYVLLLGISAGALDQNKNIFSANRRLMDQTLRAMNEKADPCVHFDEYAKGKYGKVYDLYKFFEFGLAVQEKMDPKFLALFEQLKCRSFKSGSLEEKVLKLYNACEMAMENEEADFKYWNLVQPDLNLTWPQNTPPGSQWPKEKFNWLVTLARLRRYGMVPFFRMDLELDHQGESKYMISLGSPNFVSYEYNFLWGDANWLVNQGFNKSRAEFLFRDMNELHSSLSRMLGTERNDRTRMTLQELESDHGFAVGKYLEIVFGRPFPPDFVVLVNYLEYLKQLNQVLSSYDQETVATYLMELFASYMKTPWRKPTFRAYDFLCVRMVKNTMKSVSYLLYEEFVLGQRKVQEYQAEVQRVFEAVREQFRKRLASNRLSLTNSHISSLEKILNSVTVNVGNVPKSQGYRRFLTDFYAGLLLKEEDDFPTIHLKVLELQEQLKLQSFENLELNEPYPGYEEEPILVGNGTSIVIPLPILEEPFFTIRGHDVFKVSLLGFQIAKQVLSALFPYPKLPSSSGCQKYNELMGIFDDLGKYVDNSGCISPRECEMTNWRDIILVLLNLVQDAYFSPESRFDKTQPSFTHKTLKQLFYLHFAQYELDDSFYYIYDSGLRPYNSLLYLSTFAKGFNCSISS